MDMQEIDDEIYRLEHGDTTWNSCEKLNILYGVKRGMQPEQENESRAYPRKSQSEFVEVFRSIPLEYALNVLDEHMNCIKAVYPKEYHAIIRKMTEAEVL